MAAEEIQIQGSSEKGKLREPVVTLLLCLFVPFYGLYWYYSVNKELAEIGKARNTEELGTSPGMSVLAVTLGVFILVPPFISLYNTWNRLKKGHELTGAGQPMEPIIGLLLMFVVAGYYFFQDNINKVLQGQSGGAGAIPQGGAQAAPAPEQPAAQPQQPPQ